MLAKSAGAKTRYGQCARYGYNSIQKCREITSQALCVDTQHRIRAVANIKYAVSAYPNSCRHGLSHYWPPFPRKVISVSLFVEIHRSLCGPTVLLTTSTARKLLILSCKLHSGMKDVTRSARTY